MSAANEMEQYIGYRVAKPGNMAYMASNMPESILADRRAYMRTRLKNSNFKTSTDNDLDNMRMYLVDGSYMVEDTEGRTFYLSSTLVSCEIAEERRERALIPPEYTKKILKDFNWDLYECDMQIGQKLVSKFIFNYREFADKGMGIYIYSKAKGSGKTMLSCILLNEVSSKFGVNTKFVTALDYLNMTKKSYSGSDSEVNMIRKAALLVVDDIGTQISREWTDTTFYELVNYRYNSKLPTIYTSNIPTDKLKMDERITDRIERNTIILKIPDKSIRKVNGNKEKEAFMKEMGIQNGE